MKENREELLSTLFIGYFCVMNGRVTAIRNICFNFVWKIEKSIVFHKRLLIYIVTRLINILNDTLSQNRANTSDIVMQLTLYICIKYNLSYNLLK